MAVQTIEQKRFHREAQQTFITYFLDFAWQHRHDFIALRLEFDNIHRAATLSLTEENYPLLGERAYVLSYLAEMEEALGNYAGARSLYRQQVRISNESRIKNHDELIAVLRQLVRLAKQQGDYDEAHHLLDRRLKIAEELQNVREQVDIRLELAELYQERNDLVQAGLLCRQSLELAQDIVTKLG